VIQEASGSKYARCLFADSPKGSYVFVAERMVHLLEVIGDQRRFVLE